MGAKLHRDLIRRIENENFPLIGLHALRELREQLDRAEGEIILKAREMGASAQDIADVLGITRQGAYYRLKTLRKPSAEEGEGAKEEDVVVLLHEEPAELP